MKSINIYSLLNIFVLIFVINLADGNNWRCDYTYVGRAKGYFKFHEIPANWFNAQLRCQLEGAVLASPYPQEVNETLLDLMRDHNLDRPIFTGIHATFSSGDYHTISGTPLKKIPIKWMKSEPDNKNDEENCLIITPTGLAADTKCSDTHPYFCYKEKKDTDMYLESCGTADRAYEYSPVTHSCYKFHTVPRTWSGANMACSAEGGHLAIINSDAEAEVVKNIFSKYPENKIVGSSHKGVASIGFRNWNKGGDWKTIHGETLESAGFDKFSGGQPDNAGAGEYCGTIFRTGLLNDGSCQAVYAFICEKQPNSLNCEDIEY